MAFNLSNIFRRDKLKALFTRIGTPKTAKLLLNQAGTSVPTITEVHNSLEVTLTAARAGVGAYTIDSNIAAFTVDKTIILKGIATDGDYATFNFLNVDRVSDTQIAIQTPTDGLLTNACLSIEVYD